MTTMGDRTKSRKPAARQRRRCAIYTRKSTEEGLEQDFNSLDAQREACEAYILSQKHEGWATLPALYDDGGFTGGNLNRPALQQLLEDAERGQVDVVVVYKVDRLTRSLADFAKIVEILDRNGVSFVSVTQQFNTTTSMGRLTLNVLLSFAQFEREIAGERIRDKIAASKKKGMWMGGHPPLGYDVEDKKLVVNDADAETVREIFRRYADLGSVRALKQELDDRGIVGKVRIDRHGRQTGGKPMARGALYRLLGNRIYRGEIVHKEKSYPGQHDAIVDPDLWERAQKAMAENRVEREQDSRAPHPSLLRGLLYDASGEGMTPTHAVKRGRRYRYYASRSLIAKPRGEASEGRRVPAADVENLVVELLRNFLADRSAVFEAISPHCSEAAAQDRWTRRAGRLGDELSSSSPATERRVLVRRLVKRVELHAAHLDVHLDVHCLLQALGQGEQQSAPPNLGDDSARPFVMTASARLKRVGKEMRLLFEGPNGGRIEGGMDATLIPLLVKAHEIKRRLLGGQGTSLAALADEEGVHRSYLSRMVRLAYLAPDITAAILEGHQPLGLNAKRLMTGPNVPIDWQHQRVLLGFEQTV